MGRSEKSMGFSREIVGGSKEITENQISAFI